MRTCLSRDVEHRSTHDRWAGHGRHGIDPLASSRKPGSSRWRLDPREGQWRANARWRRFHEKRYGDGKKSCCDVVASGVPVHKLM